MPGIEGDNLGHEMMQDDGPDFPYKYPVIAVEIKDDTTTRKATVDAQGNLRVALPTGTPTPRYDANVFWASNWGVTGTYISPASGTVTNITDAPMGGNKIVITDIFMSAGAVATTFLISEETSGYKLQSINVPANTTFSFYPRSKVKTPTANKRVQVQTNQVGAVVNIGYYYEP